LYNATYWSSGRQLGNKKETETVEINEVLVKQWDGDREKHEKLPNIKRKISLIGFLSKE
jgi:hypothetical protein